MGEDTQTAEGKFDPLDIAIEDVAMQTRIDPKLRTMIDFRKDSHLVRTVSMEYELPNVAVGQTLSYDHPSLSRCLHGTVTKISQVVFLVDPPLTYIDVEVTW